MQVKMCIIFVKLQSWILWFIFPTAIRIYVHISYIYMYFIHMVCVEKNIKELLKSLILIFEGQLLYS